MRKSKMVFAWWPVKTINKGVVWLQYVLKVTTNPENDFGFGKITYYRG